MTWLHITTLQLPLFYDASSAEHLVDGVRFDKCWIYGRWLKITSFNKKEKLASIVNEKPPNPVKNWGAKPTDWSMKKPLKQMIKKGKNRQIRIDEKHPNQGGTEEENRSARVKIGYNIFAFLFWVQVAAGWLRFYLVVLVSGTTKGQAIGRAMSDGGGGCCWLVKVILMEGTEQLPEMLYYQSRLPCVFLLRITLLGYHVIETW